MPRMPKYLKREWAFFLDERGKRKKRRQRESNAAHRAKTKAERWAAFPLRIVFKKS